MSGTRWRVHINYPSGRCEEEVRSGGTRRPCYRSGMYAWRGVRYCYQHHPDWAAWSLEMLRVEGIANAAIANEPEPGEAGRS